MEIIDKGSELKPKDIGNYFRNGVFQERLVKKLEYSKKPKEEIVNTIVTTINSAILDSKRRYGKNYKGIVAVIIYGSFASRNFYLGSDLDLVYVSQSKDNGDVFKTEDGEVYVDYGENFDGLLKDAIELRIDNSYGTFFIGQKDRFKKLKEEKHPSEDAYIVVSPYSHIKSRIESMLVASK